MRGDVNPSIIRKAREAGARKVYFASVTPPIGPVVDGEERGCLFGVDMSPQDNFAIRRGGLEGVKRSSGADELYYLSMESMVRAIGLPEEKLCLYCLGGGHPVRKT